MQLDEICALYGVTPEEVENCLGSSYEVARAEANRGYELKFQEIIESGDEVAEQLTARLRADGFDGQVCFQVEDVFVR